jgi:hypothetical protein
MLQVNYTHNAKVYEFGILFGLVGQQKAQKGYNTAVIPPFSG